MLDVTWPRMLPIRQRFPKSAPLDIPAAVSTEMEKVRSKLQPGARVAVAVGSRGIANLQVVVRAAVDWLKSAGAQPFVVPAMGSHGGATPEGQIALLGEYGITEAALGVPLRAALDTRLVGVTEDGVDVPFSAEALQADGIIVVNRVKPHTDFKGQLGSGVLKMLVVGLGKRAGAAAFHRASNRLGFERVLRTAARVILAKAPVLCGVALVENQLHDTALVEVMEPGSLESREEALFQEAARFMPRLPFDDVDLLIVDRLGKNISGAGMDPNVIGRSVHGYSSLLKDRASDHPAIRRLFVRELTPESHGNATGLGLADFTTTRLVNQIDRRITTINTLTALTPQGVKIPIHFDTDREVIGHALDTLAIADVSKARVMRIRDTLNLEVLEASDAYLEETRRQPDLEVLSEPSEMRFDNQGNLPVLGGS